MRGDPAEVAAGFAEAPRGEITLVLSPGPAEVAELDLGPALAAVAALLAAGTPRRAAVDVVAGLTGVARKALYDASL